MSSPKRTVLVVDDSALVRKILTTVLQTAPGIEVVTASNGAIALQRIAQSRPSLVLLDVEMPGMNGIETLREIRRNDRALPVMMFSSMTERGAKTTLEALAFGANDYMLKPSSLNTDDGDDWRAELMRRIEVFCPTQGASVWSPKAAGSAMRASNPSVPQPAQVCRIYSAQVVAIGSSTGGPVALTEVLTALPGDLSVPVVVVQHMPKLFTKHLADSLNSKCGLKVQEAEDGMPLTPGQVLIAPGGRHLCVARGSGGVIAVLNDDPPEQSCRPAVDPMFRSIAAVYGSRSLAVVLTGMGTDGAKGAEHIRAAGGCVFVQDQESSVVWGMPGAIARADLADRVVPLREMAAAILDSITARRGPVPVA